ncbi:MAG: hypothetical protein STSR0009_04310 [Methanoregula sp.]
MFTGADRRNRWEPSNQYRARVETGTDTLSPRTSLLSTRFAGKVYVNRYAIVSDCNGEEED